jgi:EpsI family protein
MNIGVRFWVIVALLISATFALHVLSHGKVVPPVKSLDNFPLTLGGWDGENVSVDPEALRVAAVDDHLNRVYQHPGELPIRLYVGYYRSQSTSETIHSPKNCLPGAGWEPVSSSLENLTLPDGTMAAVNMWVIEKGLERQLVLYWYQSHGRIIASEYWGKIYMVLDAVHLNRTDAALVRVITPIRQRPQDARNRAKAFAEQVLAQLQELIPS